MLCFDIETVSDFERAKRVCKPFDPASVPPPGSFDPAAVKTGNLKDKAKIAAKIADAKAAREKLVASHSHRVETAEADYWAKVEDISPLHSNTGNVCAIGYQSSRNYRGHLAIEGEAEADLLFGFWDAFEAMESQSRKIVGWNIFDFDLPFLFQRSIASGVEVPATAFTDSGYPSPVFVDLMKIWRCGTRPGGSTPGGAGSCSLDTVAKTCGLAGKTDGCAGAEFGKMLLSGDDEQVEAAKAYLARDVSIVFELAEMMWG